MVVVEWSWLFSWSSLLLSLVLLNWYHQRLLDIIYRSRSASGDYSNYNPRAVNYIVSITFILLSQKVSFSVHQQSQINNHHHYHCASSAIASRADKKDLMLSSIRPWREIVIFNLWAYHEILISLANDWGDWDGVSSARIKLHPQFLIKWQFTSFRPDFRRRLLSPDEDKSSWYATPSTS